MVDLAHQKRAPLISMLLVSDVGSHAADPNDPIGLVDIGGSGSHAPADLSVWSPHAELDRARLAVFRQAAKRSLEAWPIIRVNEQPGLHRRRGKAVGLEAEDPALTLVPAALALDRVPGPGAHLAGGECQALQPFALQHPLRR